MAERPPHSPAWSQPLSWFPQFLRLGKQRFRARVRLLLLAALVGVVAGLAAIAFAAACQLVEHYALDEIAGYRTLTPPRGEPELFPRSETPLRPWLLLLVPAVGGLLTGLLVYTLAPEAEGHGTDSVISAYHREQGQMRPRVPLVKIVASALTLGSGGSGGREGPIAQVGAGFGSLLANLLRLGPVERRILLAAGMGAGIAAIFRAPLAGALFAAEVLYRSPEFEPEVLIPAGISSTLAYATFGTVFGWRPLFDVPAGLVFASVWQLGPYLILAVGMTLLAMIYVRSFYGIRYLFQRLALPPALKPALGAFLNGAVAVALYFFLHEQAEVLAVLSFGYGILQAAVEQPAGLGAGLLLAVALGKILTTSLTIGSGGSGGVFGPSMVIGGCGGGALGLACHSLWPELVPQPVTFVIVGMGGFFAAAAKTPFSTLVMVGELTGSYNLLLPALWVCMLAYMFADTHSIYSAQVEDHTQSLAHRGAAIHAVLAGISVNQLLTPEVQVPALRPEDSLAVAAERLRDTVYLALPVVDADRRLLGILSVEEVFRVAPDGRAKQLAADLMRKDVLPLTPDDHLDRAVELFMEMDLWALPVVAGEDRQVLGMLRRSEIARLYLRIVHG